jgi:iron complex transport system ATP-binding protein
MIELRHVSFERDDRLILDDVSWHVRDREHWAIVGANGAGKTTLLQLVCGALWPTSGEVYVLGRHYGQVDLRELRKRIGWFSAALERQVSPSDLPRNLVVSGKFASIGLQFDRPTAADYRRADELLDFLGCAAIARQAFATLSQGERQKVLLCRALMPRPDLLILDEPCTGLDLASRERLLESIEKLGRDSRGPTLLMVTHHIEEIVPAVARTLLLKDGRIAAQGPKDEVLRGPVLSAALGVTVHVRQARDRFWVRLHD